MIIYLRSLTGARSNEPLQAVVENQLNESALQEKDNSILERNRALLQYTATIANSNSTKDEFNYEFVDSLVKGGADINIADQHGQTIFHEVARSWNTDIAGFLLNVGKRLRSWRRPCSYQYQYTWINTAGGGGGGVGSILWSMILNKPKMVGRDQI